METTTNNNHKKLISTIERLIQFKKAFVDITQQEIKQLEEDILRFQNTPEDQIFTDSEKVNLEISH